MIVFKINHLRMILRIKAVIPIPKGCFALNLFVRAGVSFNYFDLVVCSNLVVIYFFV